MVKRIKYILFIILILTSSALADSPSVISSGGKNNAQFMDIKGEAVIGRSTAPDGTVGEFGGVYVLTPDTSTTTTTTTSVAGATTTTTTTTTSAAGATTTTTTTTTLPKSFVPLSIDAVNVIGDGAVESVKIYWDVAAYPNPQIFVFMEDQSQPTGQFINGYDENKWKPAADVNRALGDSEFDDPGDLADGELLHINMVGAASARREVYYKGLIAGADPKSGNDFELAPAVGKINMPISRQGASGWNFIAYPFDNRDIRESIFGSFSNNDELRIWNESDKQFVGNVKFQNDNWKESFELQRGQGYTIYRALGGAPITATVIGAVNLDGINRMMSRRGASGWNLFGVPFLTQRSVGALDPANAHANDEIRLWDETTKQFTASTKRSAWQNLGLNVGKGYWYYRAIEDPVMDWRIDY